MTENNKSIGEITIDYIIHGGTNQEVIDAVRKVHPDAKSNDRTVSWYRTRLKSAGAQLPSAWDAPGFDRDYSMPKNEGIAESTTRQKARGLAFEIIVGNGTNEQAYREATEAFPDSGLRKREVTDLRHILVHWPGKNVLSDSEARKFQVERDADLSRDPRDNLTDDERERCKVLLEELKEILAI
jgi:hypothetical protein